MASLAKAMKNPSKCIADCIDNLVVLTKMIKALPAVLEIAKNAGLDEFEYSKRRNTGMIAQATCQTKNTLPR
ncbi:hypothetical protein ZWY2020_045732 [Hordeum vulgare]|nr:hypothetical protein ZWY2020_045732 [Hordeum vulgare]